MQNLPQDEAQEVLFEVARARYSAWRVHTTARVNLDFEQMYALLCDDLTQKERTVKTGLAPQTLRSIQGNVFRDLPGCKTGESRLQEKNAALRSEAFARAEEALFRSEPMRYVIESARKQRCCVKGVPQRGRPTQPREHLISVNDVLCAVYFARRENRAAQGLNRSYGRIGISFAATHDVHGVAICLCPQGYEPQVFVSSLKDLVATFHQGCKWYLTVCIPLDQTQRESRRKWKEYKDAWPLLKGADAT